MYKSQNLATMIRIKTYNENFETVSSENSPLRAAPTF